MSYARPGKILLYVLFTGLIIWFYLGTGLHGDDYSVIFNYQANGAKFSAFPSGLMPFNLGAYYTFWWAYPMLGFEHQWVYDIVKAFAHILSLILVYRFAIDYLPHDRAMLASVVFMFYPLHDTTMYWYMTAPYVLFPAVLMFAHAMIRADHFKLGLLLAVLGAFGGYFSPPYVFGLAAIFLFEHNFRKAVLFAFPGVLYVTYYFCIKFLLPGAEMRINSSLTFFDYMKQMVLQLLSFTEAAIGPSYWLKIFYATGSLSFISCFIALSVLVFLVIKAPSFSNRPVVSKSLFFGLSSILLLSFGMFALTGLYHHSAFNLGNRTTVYGSLLIAFLLALLPLNKKTIFFFLLIFILPVFGLSDHWKSWNVHQKAIIENIHTNPLLKTLAPESTLLVTGNIYSKLGPFSHIEFFSMPWVVESIFKGWVKSKDVVALAPYIKLDHGFLVDPKFGGKYSLNKKIYVYNSETNSVTLIAATEVPKLLADRPKEIRHWVQLAKGTWIESSIVTLSPRLAYLFL